MTYALAVLLDMFVPTLQLRRHWVPKINVVDGLPCDQFKVERELEEAVTLELGITRISHFGLTRLRNVVRLAIWPIMAAADWC